MKSRNFTVLGVVAVFLLAMSLTSVSFASIIEEENEIVARHDAWMARVMRERGYNPAHDTLIPPREPYNPERDSIFTGEAYNGPDAGYVLHVCPPELVDGSFLPEPLEYAPLEMAPPPGFEIIVIEPGEPGNMELHNEIVPQSGSSEVDPIQPVGPITLPEPVVRVECPHPADNNGDGYDDNDPIQPVGPITRPDTYTIFMQEMEALPENGSDPNVLVGPAVPGPEGGENLEPAPDIYPGAREIIEIQNPEPGEPGNVELHACPPELVEYPLHMEEYTTPFEEAPPLELELILTGIEPGEPGNVELHNEGYLDTLQQVRDNRAAIQNAGVTVTAEMAETIVLQHKK